MKILFFCGHGNIASFGGTEKVLCNFATEFIRRGFDVGVVLNEIKRDARPLYQVDSRVRWFNLAVKRIVTPTRLLLKIWRELTRPFRKTILAPLFPDFYDTVVKTTIRRKLDVVLRDFHPDVVILCFVDDARKFFYKRDRVDFATIQMFHFPPETVLDPKDGATLDRCDLVQVLHRQYANAVQKSTTTPVAVVPNVVPQFAERVDVDERERSGAPRIVCVGRYDKRQKRQHLLLRAFQKIANDYPNWNLYFFGNDYKNGLYQRRLRRLVFQSRLRDRAFLCPSTPKIFDEMLRSDIFAFPSSFEGFSLALTEAQSLGLPAVGFRSTPSVNELIVDGENGFLADDVDDFAQKLKTLVESKELRRKFGAAAKKGVEQYEASRVWDRWETLIRETIERKRREVGS